MNQYIGTAEELTTNFRNDELSLCILIYKGGYKVYDLNSLFRKRINIPEEQLITFENLHEILKQIAMTIPFENLSIFSKRTSPITKENLIEKILKRNEGGLCYELNTILYIFLIENGFDVSLVGGIVYNQEKQQWNTNGRTHITIVLRHEGQVYLVDTGFGGNLPLKPVPLTGEVIVSDNGEFRVEQVENEAGDYILYMKLKYKDSDWKIGYGFESKQFIDDFSQLDKVQEIIKYHPQSPFNKRPLITKRTNNGSIILTDTSWTEWFDGEVTKKEIHNIQYAQLLRTRFDIRGIV